MMKDALPLLERQLDRLAAAGALIEIYRDRLRAAPFVGRLLRTSPHAFLVAKLDELYRPDGIAVARSADITRVKFGGRELEAGASVAQIAESYPSLPDVALLEISAAVTVLQREYGHVSLYLERLDPNVCFIGEVIDLDDDFVLLRQFGALKSMDRSELLLRLDEITRVDANGAYEQQLVALHRQTRGTEPR